MCKRLKALGANCVSPLFNDTHGSVAKVKAFCDAARAEGLIVVVNADHFSSGTQRAKLNAPDMVALLNGYDHVMLAIEVETDQVSTDAQWLAGVKSLIDSVRGAGHKSVLKVGAPEGGRRVEFCLRGGTAAIAYDPEHQLALTWQAYWPSSTTPTWYQQQAGVAPGIAGTKAVLAQVAASGLPFLIGFDWHDNIGNTGELELMAEAHRLGLSYQHWALTGDGTLAGNNLIDRFDWTRSLASITPNGIALRDVLLAQRVLASL
jgi:hypothetical protein